MKKTLLLALLASTLYTTATAQKGEKSLSAGTMLMLPFETGDPIGYLDNGWGAEVNGLYKFSKRSGLQVLSGIGDIKAKYFADHWTFYWVRAGYRYQFGASGVYLNGLLGPEFDWDYGDPLMTYAVSGGKRFQVSNSHFIDACIEYVGGNTEPRVDIKLAFGLQWPRKP